MGEVHYRPVIEDMTWSFSRLTCFESCQYQWYLKYIRQVKDSEKFYASYGKFVHKLLAEYYTGRLSKEELLPKFTQEFSSSVCGVRPEIKTVEKYISAGVEYFKNFEDFKCSTIAAEKHVSFMVGGKPFTGYIDYIGANNGEIYLIDHKSRNLRPKSNRKSATLYDKELDAKLRQLYIYSKAIKDELGEYPKWLCFNCFKSNVFIKTQFDESAYQNTIDWAVDLIEKIENTTDFFNPSLNVFYCKWICPASERCEYYDFYFNDRGR